MPNNECCSSSPRLDFRQFLKDITWVNEDDPEANRSLLEGLKVGYTGYSMDNIIQPSSRKLQNYLNYQTAFKGHGVRDCGSPWPTCENNEHDQPVNPNDEQFKSLQMALYGTSLLSATTRPSSSPPLKRISALTVRPTIGEERRSCVVDSRRAYCMDRLQGRCPTNAAAGMFCRDDEEASFYLDPSSLSCPELPARSDCCPEIDNSNKYYNGEEITENESCYIFQQVGGGMKPSNIRLSPRIEKLGNYYYNYPPITIPYEYLHTSVCRVNLRTFGGSDKLIPTTSKEFLNTLRIVNTISPQPSEEQLHIITQQSLLNSGICTNENCNCKDNSGMMLDGRGEGDQQFSDTDIAFKKACNSGRSYKEVFLYGPPQTSPTTPEPEDTTSLVTDGQSYNIRSSSCFPSLPKPNQCGFGGDGNQKNSPPLWSTILQKSPTSSSSSTSDVSSETKRTKTSPSSISGSFDCGFCRTNNEPEEVYRSHPLRVNDIVVCPSLRKYICCFCGATGDKAHTIKYCPKNPLGFYAKKTRPLNLGINLGEKLQQAEAEGTPCQSPEKEGAKCDDKNFSSTDQESKSDSESISIADDLSEPTKCLSGIWIEAKPKGRKKKVLKLV